MNSKLISISDQKLSLDQAYDFILDEGCGGNCLFVGTVRNQNKGASVRYLDFETYEEMAIKKMTEIAERCQEEFNIKKIAILHRSGEVRIKETAVIIAVSSVHRDESFKACRYAIDNLKNEVPIWKKEFLEDGSYWVGARP